ncbi:grasp-with-spasm system SPASM domain peptide maturase [Aquimarina agarilytica]|uniref:grasp-with-spasm system SPASM domain peptide maturase n=1 Tax=Aquimarina agarilytica TaxID=1087449 RepID=UPI000289A31D|nr:grasp-with-spasm system SPASM domain peptide maturase [Aquimarina agarilytica]
MKKNIDQFNFKIFESCKPVKGAKRAIICDLERKTALLINEDLYTILTKNKNNTIAQIKSQYGHKNNKVIDDYFNYLIKHEVIFLCTVDELELFPEIQTHWNTPSVITNAIIDVDSESNHNFNSIFQELNDLGCKDVLLRFFDNTTLVYLTRILEKLNKSSIENIELILKYSGEFDNNLNFTELKNKFQRIASITIYDSPINNVSPNLNSTIELKFITNSLDSDTHCGFISPNHFRFENSFFFESLNFNNCLNRKISIDKKGNLKNCPSMKDHYGNIATKTISEVIENKKFTHLWTIKKDAINKCKDCEFRYICSDCRAFTEDNSMYSKPLHCNYNPYEAAWEENSN